MAGKGPAMYKRQSMIKSLINVLTPVTYQLKKPALYDFYEGESPIDWAKLLYEAPVAIAFQATFGRAGRHGDHNPDRAVAHFVDEARAHRVKYGLYHFLTPGKIAEQATFYINTVENLGGLGNMNPIVDIEYEPNPRDKNAVSGHAWANDIKQWLDLVETHFHLRPIIYTSANFWKYTFERGMPPLWTSQYPLWTAGYPWTAWVDANKTCPPAYIPAGWKRAHLWQYAENGRTKKYSANDLNLLAPELMQEIIR